MKVRFPHAVPQGSCIFPRHRAGSRMRVRLCWLGDPIRAPMPRPQRRWGRSYGRGRLELPAVMPNTVQGAEQRSRLPYVLPQSLRGYRRPEEMKEIPTRDFSGSFALPTASSQGRGWMLLPLRVCRSRSAWLAQVRNSTRPPANTAWSALGAAWFWAVPATCRQETPLFHFFSRRGDGGKRGATLVPFCSLPRPPCRPLPDGRSKRACRGTGGALSQPLFFPLARRVPSSLAGC